MPYCSESIAALANQIYQDIGSPTALSVTFISGWITNSGGMIGSLNNKLSTNFWISGDEPCIVGGFGGEEAVIANLDFKTDYYGNQSRSVLTGGGSMWTSISEGDTKISRSDVVNVSKQYLQMQKDSRETLRLAIQDWKRSHIGIEIVDAEQTYSRPTP